MYNDVMTAGAGLAAAAVSGVFCYLLLLLLPLLWSLM